MDLVSILKDFGLPVAIIAAGMWFFYKSLWPYMKKQIEDSQARAVQIHEKMLLSEQEHAKVSQKFYMDMRALAERYDKTTNRFLDSLAERDEAFEKYKIEEEQRNNERHAEIKRLLQNATGIRHEENH